MLEYNGFDLDKISDELAGIDTLDVFDVLKDYYNDAIGEEFFNSEELQDYIADMHPTDIFVMGTRSEGVDIYAEYEVFRCDGYEVETVDEADVVSEYINDEGFLEYIVDNDLLYELGIDEDDVLA